MFLIADEEPIVEVTIQTFLGSIKCEKCESRKNATGCNQGGDCRSRRSRHLRVGDSPLENREIRRPRKWKASDRYFVTTMLRRWCLIGNVFGSHGPRGRIIIHIFFCIVPISTLNQVYILISNSLLYLFQFIEMCDKGFPNALLPVGLIFMSCGFLFIYFIEESVQLFCFKQKTEKEGVRLKRLVVNYS